MATEGCFCGNNALGNLGRPPCVLQMYTIASIIVWPRFDEDNNRSSIDLTSPTLGADIRALIEADSTPLRIYPFPKFENVTLPRTDTVYETAPSNRKVKIPFVGGIRSFTGELWDKDAVEAMLRELESYGCGTYDFAIIDVAGQLWIHKDTPESTVANGFKMDSATFDAFKMYATDTTTNKINVSFDFDKYQKDSTAYALTPEDLGYPATDLEGLQSGYMTVEALTTTTWQVTVFGGFGSALNTNKIKGIITANFNAFNEVDDTSVTVSGAVENDPGIYTLTTAAQGVGEIVTFSVINFSGFDIAEASDASL